MDPADIIDEGPEKRRLRGSGTVVCFFYNNRDDWYAKFVTAISTNEMIIRAERLTSWPLEVVLVVPTKFGDRLGDFAKNIVL
jgi:hypothetical protein